MGAAVGGQSLRRRQNEDQGAAKALGAVLLSPKKNRKGNSASGAVVDMVSAMGLHAIRQFPRQLGGRAALPNDPIAFGLLYGKPISFSGARSGPPPSLTRKGPPSLTRNAPPPLHVRYPPPLRVRDPPSLTRKGPPSRTIRSLLVYSMETPSHCQELDPDPPPLRVRDPPPERSDRFWFTLWKTHRFFKR